MSIFSPAPHIERLPEARKSIPPTNVFDAKSLQVHLLVMLHSI